MRTKRARARALAVAGSVALAAVVMVLGLGTRQALAVVCDAPTKTWDGGGGNDLWATGNNWNPNGVPTSSDDVCISGASVRIASSSQARSLEVASGSTLSIEGTGALSLGAVASSIDAGATLSAGGNVSGTATLSNAGTISGTGNATISSPLTNDGSIHVIAGTLRLTGNNTSSGSVQIDSGAVLSHAGNTTTYTAGSISGAGRMVVAGAIGVTLQSGVTYGLDAFEVTNGKLTLNQNYEVPTVTVGTGTLDGSGDLSVTSAFSMGAGATHSGTGTTTLKDTATGSLATTMTLGRSLVLEASTHDVEISGAGTLANAAGGNGAITNSRTLDITGNSTVAVPVTNTVDGTLKKSITGTGNATISSPLTNDGSIHVIAGTLRLTGNNTSSGSVQIDSGAVLSHAGNTTTYTAGSISGAGRMVVAGAIGVTLQSGVTYGLDAFEVTNGKLTLNQNYEVPTVTVGTGTLDGSGDLSVTSAFSMGAGATHSGTGTTTLKDTATGSLATTMTLGRSLVLEASTHDVEISGAGTLANAAGGNGAITNSRTLDITGNSTVAVPVTNTVDGTLKKSITGTGNATISSPLTNDGSIHVIAGTLRLTGNNTSSGSVQIDSGAVLSHAGNTTTYTAGSISGAGRMVVAGAIGVTLQSGVTYGLDAFEVTNGKLTLNQNYEVPTVTVGTGTLDGSGDLSVTSAFSMGAGATHSGTGTTTLKDTATGSLATTMTLGRSLVLEASTHDVEISGAGTLANAAGGNGAITNSRTLDITGNSTVAVPVTNTVDGTLKKSITGTGNATISSPLTNDGSIHVIAGTLRLTGNNTSSGSVQIDSGAVLSHAGNTTTYTAGSISGAGRMVVAGAIGVTLQSGVTYGLDAFEVTNGKLTLNQNYEVPTVTVGTGTLDGSGDLSVTSAFSMGAGATHSGTGTTTLKDTATGSLATTMTLGRSLVLEASTHDVEISGAGTLANAAGGNGAITNSRTLDITGNSTVAVPVTNTVDGTLKKSITGTGNATISSPLTNDGSIHVIAGTLRLTGNNTSSGSVQIDSGAVLSHAGNTTTYTAGSISGAGRMVVAGAIGVTLQSGVTYGLDAFEVTNGKLTLNQNYEVPTVTVGTGTLDGSGDLSVTSAFSMGAGATHSGTGTTTLKDTATGSLATTMTLGRSLVLEASTHDVEISGAGTLANAAGGNGAITNSRTLDITGNSTVAVPVTNTVDGTLKKSTSAGTASVTGGLTNSGDLAVVTGVLSVGGSFTNYNQTTDVLSGGTYHVSAMLRFTGADIVTNQSTIVLSGPSALVQDTSGNDGFRDFTTNPGSLTVDGGKTLTLPKALTNTGALVVGAGSTLGAPSVTLNGGTLSGTGTVAAPVSNPGGTVSPGFSPGALSITGSYTQGAGGSLPIEIGGTSPGTGHDQLNIGGAATLNGTLTLSTLDPFVPVTGQTFTIMTYASHSGCFSTINGRDLSAVDPAMFYDVDCGPSAATVTVKRPEVSIDDVTVTEGDTGSTDVTFTVSVTTPRPDASLSVDFATTDETAVTPDDYASKSGTVTWAPGDGADKSVTVHVAADTMDEFDETFTVDLSNPTRVAIVDGSGTGTITDDDPPPTISVDDATVDEGDTGTTPATFTVALSAPSGKPISIDYATSDGSASTLDYTPAAGPLTFAPGQTSRQVAVGVIGDTLDEFDETFTVDLSNPSNVVIVDGSGTGTITDDDPPPAVSIDDATVGEGDSGTAEATFTVSLSAASGKTITVDYSTADGTAVAPDDYAAGANTLTFDPGQTSKPVKVLVNGDALDEFDETFTVDLSDPSNVVIADSSGVGTISDDDLRPTVSIGDATATEGDSGTTPAAFTVSLSAPSGKPISVDYATSDDTAKAPADYASAADTISFAPGQTSKQVTVDVAGETLFEGDETFTVNLSNPSNVGISDASGTGTISDDDPAPSLAIDDVSVTEGNSGTKQAAFTVSLAGSTALTTSVDFSTHDGTATAPGDYTPASGTLTFAPGDGSKLIAIAVKGDTTVESDETFTVDLTNAVGATIADASGTGTIRNDDSAALTLSIDDRSQAEGDSSTTPMTFTVSLSSASAQTVTVHYATANGTAVSGSDYVAKSGTLTFAAGVTTRPVSVSVKGDLVDEADEAFTVNLSQPVNAQIADGSGTGTILDDDPKPPVITGFGSASAVQGGTVAIKGTHLTGVTKVTFAKAGGGTVDAITFTVNSDTKITATVPALATTGRVSVTNAAGSATSPADLLIKPKIVSFSPGSGAVGTVVTITGTGFTGATQVTFRGLNAPVFTVVSDTQITVTVPNKAKTGKIAVITPGGKGTSATSFTVL